MIETEKSDFDIDVASGKCTFCNLIYSSNDSRLICNVIVCNYCFEKYKSKKCERSREGFCSLSSAKTKPYKNGYNDLIWFCYNHNRSYVGLDEEITDIHWIDHNMKIIYPKEQDEIEKEREEIAEYRNQIGKINLNRIRNFYYY